MDRITKVLVRNVRAIESVDLDLSASVTVLIGENGSGKSTILECLEILRKAADAGFMQPFYTHHRGAPGLLRHGASSMGLGVVVEDDEGRSPRIEYTFTLAAHGSGVVVTGEALLVGPTSEFNAGIVPNVAGDALRVLLQEARRRQRAARQGTAAGIKRLAREVDALVQQVDASDEAHRGRSAEPLAWIHRRPDGGEVYQPDAGHYAPVPSVVVAPDRLMISALGPRPPHDPMERVVHALRGLEIHLGFDTLASWAAMSMQRTQSLRVATTHYPANRLELLGTNLANAWSELLRQRESHRERTMALVRLGLGDRVESVVVEPDRGGGSVHLSLRLTDSPVPVYVANLSDGQIAWLCFIAMTRLNEGRSLLAVDEPELHLHPQLLGGVLALLSELGTPVVLATHADRILELLDDPADAVRVCRLDEQGRAAVVRIDADALQPWMAKFGDLGRLRAAGYLPRVLDEGLGSAEEPT